MTALPEAGAPDVAYLLDATWVCRRAVEQIEHGGGHEYLPDGRPIAPAKLVLRQIAGIMRARRPAYMGLAFDGEGSWRKLVWPAYKADRPEPPASMAITVEIVTQWAARHEMPVWRVLSYEADDVLAAVTRRLRRVPLRIVVVTSDKDLAQLLDDSGVVLWDGRSESGLGAEEVRADRKRFGGVGPERLGDLLALAGDKADGVPGLPGVGPVKAAKLLAQHESVEHLLAHPDWHPEPLRSVLRERAADVRAWRRVVELDTRAPVRVNLDELAVGWSDAARIRAGYLRLGMTILAEEVRPMPKPKSRTR